MITMQRKEIEELAEKGKLDFYDYHGMTMSPGFPASSLDKIRETRFHDDDIIVATYPKCGKNLLSL